MTTRFFEKWTKQDTVMTTTFSHGNDNQAPDNHTKKIRWALASPTRDWIKRLLFVYGLLSLTEDLVKDLLREEIPSKVKRRGAERATRGAKEKKEGDRDSPKTLESSGEEIGSGGTGPQ